MCNTKMSARSDNPASPPGKEEALVKQKPPLWELLKFAGAHKDTFTMKEVIFYIGQYIMSEQLYDEKEQHIINCANYLLGDLFGVLSFSAKEPKIVYAMISRNLTAVSREENETRINLKKTMFLRNPCKIN
uniref:DM2 domain-containing protein n=1 Tax=Pelodiscus sinensis TaxID=13735 RepID=K7F0N6_PELSI